MRKGLTLVLAAGVAAVAAVPVRAQQVPVQNVLLRNSFNPFGAGARGLGMGGAFIAVADDGTASTFNPAGLAQLRSSELAIVGFGERVRSTTTVPRLDGDDVRSVTSQHGSADFVGLAVPFEVHGRNLTIQMSYQRAVDLFGEGRTESQGFARADDLFTSTQLRQLGLTATQILAVGSVVEPTQRGAFHVASMAAAYQVAPRLSLGMSFNYWIGEWHAEGTTSGIIASQQPRPPGAGGAPQPPLEVQFAGFAQDFDDDQSLRGFNISAGFLVRHSWISLGGVVRLPFTGDYQLDEVSLRQDFIRDRLVNEDFVDTTFSSGLQWPRSAGLGLALRPLRGLTLAGEVSVFNWSGTTLEQVPDGVLLTDAVETVEVPSSDPTEDSVAVPVSVAPVDRNFFDLLPATETTTQDTWQWRAGLEYLVSLPKVVVPLRGGIFRDRSPVVLDVTADQGRAIRGWTAGIGLNFTRVVFDVAFERRETDGLIGFRLRAGRDQTEIDTSSSPREDVQVDRIVASIIYRAGGQSDPIKKLFRKVFLGGDDEAGGGEATN